LFLFGLLSIDADFFSIQALLALKNEAHKNLIVHYLQHRKELQLISVATPTENWQNGSLVLVAGAANLISGFSLPGTSSITPGSISFVVGSNTYTEPAIPNGTLIGTPAGSGTITVSGLTTGTAYTFTVTATNSVGTSAASAASNSITPVAIGFLASAVYSATTYNQSRYVAPEMLVVPNCH